MAIVSITSPKSSAVSGNGPEGSFYIMPVAYSPMNSDRAVFCLSADGDLSGVFCQLVHQTVYEIGHLQWNVNTNEYESYPATFVISSAELTPMQITVENSKKNGIPVLRMTSSGSTNLSVEVI